MKQSKNHNSSSGEKNSVMVTPFSLKKAVKAVNESMKIEGYNETSDRQLKMEARKFAFGK